MIEVWAPDARQVEVLWLPPERVEAGDQSFHRREMTAGDGGWWRWEPSGDDEGAGTAYEIDYAFVIDGDDPPLPDPRGAWQPHGVHGPSRSFDASAHEWHDQEWRGVAAGAGVLGRVIYELHIGTFTDEGTFDAAIERLDHLVQLGVDVVEVMPVAAFPETWGWGYDGVSLYAVQHSYGGPAAFQRLVDACHGRGLGVCLDVVHNHLGPSGNYLARFGPYFTDAHTTPWGPAVNLDQPGNEQVRRFLVDSALRWLRDFHVDALRLDAVHELVDDSERHFLAQLSDEVATLAARLGRPLELIAESDLNDDIMVTPTRSGGHGMTAQWEDDVHHALHVALTGETQGYYADFAGDNHIVDTGRAFGVLAKALTRGFVHDGVLSTFRDRDWGKPLGIETFDARRLLGYLQTHDQVGNRATGDRIGSTITPGRQAAGAALYLLSPFTPMVFMGEEWAASTPWQFFTSFGEEGLAEAVRQGRRAEFAAHGWAAEDVPDPQDTATRDRSVLRWSEVSVGDHAAMLRWYAALIAVRRERLGDETRLVDVSCTFDAEAEWFTMTHRGVTVVANLAAEEQGVPAPASEIALAWREEARPGAGQVVLPGHGVAVLVRD